MQPFSTSFISVVWVHRKYTRLSISPNGIFVVTLNYTCYLIDYNTSFAYYFSNIINLKYKRVPYKEYWEKLFLVNFFFQNGLNTLFKILKIAQALMEDINLGPYSANILVIRSVVQVRVVFIFISRFCQVVQTFKSAVPPQVPYALGWQDLFGSAQNFDKFCIPKLWIC